MAFPRIDTLTNNLKLLQPLPEGMDQATYDLTLSLTIDKLLNDVAAFINAPIEEIPASLDSTLLLKLSGWFTDAGVLMPVSTRQDNMVKSLTEGDVQVQWATPAWAIAKLQTMSFIDEDFQRTLIKYRRLPSWGTVRSVTSYDTTI